MLANWGLGLEVLKVLHWLSNVEIAMVVTRYCQNSCDKWDNAVYDFSRKQGYRTTVQENISFCQLRDEIVQSEIDLLISHAFMRILPKKVYSAPKYGSINIHASLLPKYRGPSPSFWVLKNREKETGLTCHYIDASIDTGDIIYQVSIPVEPQSSLESIIESQKRIVPKLLTEAMVRIADNDFSPTPQDSALASFAPRPVTMEYDNENV